MVDLLLSKNMTLYFKSRLFMPGQPTLLEMVIELWFTFMANYPCKTVSAMSFVFMCVSVSICKSRYCVQ